MFHSAPQKLWATHLDNIFRHWFMDTFGESIFAFYLMQKYYEYNPKLKLFSHPYAVLWIQKMYSVKVNGVQFGCGCQIP